jgi:hypothetical protein
MNKFAGLGDFITAKMREQFYTYALVVLSNESL